MALSRRIEPFAIAGCIALVLLCNLSSFLRRCLSTPETHVYIGTQFWSPDYNVYLGHYKEGAEAVSFRIHDKHTSEPHDGFLLRREYWLWGYFAGRLLRLPIWAVYHSARATAALFLLLSIYFVVRRVFARPSGRIAAFVAATLVAGFPKLVLEPGKGSQVDLYLYWFEELDAANRFTALFHYLVGHILLLGFVLSVPGLARAWGGPSPARPAGLLRLAGLVAIGWAAGLAHPSTLATLCLMVPVYLGLRLAVGAWGGSSEPRAHPKTSPPPETLPLLLFVACALPVVLFVKQQTETFPWNKIAEWDLKNVSSVPFGEYVMGIGPNFFLGCAGILWLAGAALSGRPLREENPAADGRPPAASLTLLLLAAFAISVFAWGFVLHPLLPKVNRLRFFQMPLYAPFAVFTALLLERCAARLAPALPWPSLRVRPAAVHLLLVLSLVLLTARSYVWGVQREFTMIRPGDPIIHMDRARFGAYRWLDDHTSPDKVVLGDRFAAERIPGLSGNTSYWGHDWSTVDLKIKAPMADRFFTGGFSVEEARAFLQEGRIAYVLAEAPEPERRVFEKSYAELLDAVFVNGPATVYRVR